MSEFTIHAVALLLHAVSLMLAAVFGHVIAQRPDKAHDAGGLAALTLCAALAAYALQVAA